MVELNSKGKLYGAPLSTIFIVRAHIPGLAEELRSIILGSNPEVTVAVDGDNYTITTHTEIKDVIVQFTLGQEYEADPGTGNVGKVRTVIIGP